MGGWGAVFKCKRFMNSFVVHGGLLSKTGVIVWWELFTFSIIVAQRQFFTVPQKV